MILIVDDEEDVCFSLKSILQRAGYNVFCATSTRSALVEVEKRCFDLIFLDVCLPESSSLELFREIKRISPRSKVCIITGWPEGIDVYGKEYLSLLGEGALDCLLRKPFPKEQILDVVRDLLKS